MNANERIQLPSQTPGTYQYIDVFHYGKPGAGKKVYIQAGLHADEAPGFLVAHHLKKLLNISDIKGEIILVPAANPIGLSQWKDDMLQGRFHFATSLNFNRHHLDVTETVSQKIKDLLSEDAQQNVALIRTCFKDALEEVATEDDVGFLKKQLLSLAFDADIVLDLHCDNEALLHLYMGTPLWPEGADLAAHIGAKVILLAKISGDNPFDEACSRIWWDLAAAYPDKPIPPACFSATVELRGAADTTPETAEKDALNIIRFLQGRGVLGNQAPHIPPLQTEAMPLTGVDYVTANVPGIITFVKELGEQVCEGDVIAEITNPLPGDGEQQVTTAISRTDGILFTRISDRFSYPGRILAKVAGAKQLRDETEKLLTQ